MPQNSKTVVDEKRDFQGFTDSGFLCSLVNKVDISYWDPGICEEVFVVQKFHRLLLKVSSAFRNQKDVFGFEILVGDQRSDHFNYLHW